MRQLMLIVTTIFLTGIAGNLFAQGGTAGTHKFMITGLGQTSFISEQNENSTIETAFEPIFLYSANKNLLFEGELEVEIEDGGQFFNLEYAQVLYVVSDYLILGAGQFLNPSNFFIERQQPAWINKFPDTPFFQHEDTKLQAPTHIGFQVRGGVPAGKMKIQYAAYLGNGPVLDVGTGLLEFSNFGDNNSNKVIGGRVSILPVPQVEIGYGVETSKVGDSESDFADVKALNNTVDFTYTTKVNALKGGVDVRAQATWLNIDNPQMAPLTFDNLSKGGYAQIAYHPYNVDSPILKNVEFAYRYDWVDQPDSAPSNAQLTRSSIGLNYWLSASSLFKFTYETASEELPGEPGTSSDRFIGQLAIGF